jgi:hypothetical protein
MTSGLATYECLQKIAPGPLNTQIVARLLLISLSFIDDVDDGTSHGCKPW